MAGGFGVDKMTINQTDQAPDISQRASKPRSRRFWIWLSLGILFLVLLVLSFAEDTIDVTETNAPPVLPLVSVDPVVAGPQTVRVRAFADVRPRWSADLSAAVIGRVDRVFDSALAGEPVAAGTPLIEIENSRYVAELAAAELELKQAELGLWQAKNATQVAQAEFTRTKTPPPNDLALKLPQLGIAESAVTSAKARVAAAKRQFEDATIVAPFSAFVTDRFVSPGQFVNVGDRLLKLADNTGFELVAELGQRDWLLLKRPLAGQTAEVLNQQGEVIAKATVRRGGGFLDETTRQYRVFLEIENPDTTSILAGDFVTIVLPGATVPSALDIPASALTKEGYVWHLDDDNRLLRSEPEVLFRRQDRVIVKSPGAAQDLRVARTPLVSFLPGQQVEPRFAED